MVRGSGTWRSDAGVYPVEEGYFLVLNHGRTYSLEIESGRPRESFCPFFRGSRVPVTEAALGVGFESPAAFSRRFTQSFGMSPARYRATHHRSNHNTFVSDRIPQRPA